MSNLPERIATIDIETLALTQDALVLSIGFCIFNPHKQNTVEELLDQGINVVLNYEEQTGQREENNDTINWWSKQSDLARQSVNLDTNDESNSVKLADFWDHVNKVLNEEQLSYLNGDLHWYARGTHFDVSTIENLFTQFDVPFLWHYNEPRDIRTFQDALNWFHWPKDTGLVKHNSLHDAVEDAMIIQAALVGTHVSHIGLDL